ncbi:MAG: GNAT family N-acetyltransferase [Rhodoblastus sp.]
MSPQAFQIVPARTSADYQEAIRLFGAYAGTLSVDLSFQGFEDELENMPGEYAPPKGELLLARTLDGEAIGCVALRPLPAEPGLCEMKRLYVARKGRRLGAGKGLVEAILKVAVSAGYTEMRLDTLPSMAAALALYAEAGFARIKPYYNSPIAGAVFLARKLP